MPWFKRIIVTRSISFMKYSASIDSLKEHLEVKTTQFALLYDETIDIFVGIFYMHCVAKKNVFGSFF